MGPADRYLDQARFSRLTNGCAWNAVSAFANCGRAVAHVRGSYGPDADFHNISLQTTIASFRKTRLANTNTEALSVSYVSEWRRRQIADPCARRAASQSRTAARASSSSLRNAELAARSACPCHHSRLRCTAFPAHSRALA